MIIINIKFKSIQVVKFGVKEGIEFSICFDDGGEDRCINKTNLIESPEALAEEIFLEIRKMEKRYNQQYGGDLFDDVILVRFDEEEKTLQRLAGFFMKVKEKVQNIKTAKDSRGYLDKINEIKQLKMQF